MKATLNSCIIYGAIKREDLLVKRKLNEEKVKKIKFNLNWFKEVN